MDMALEEGVNMVSRVTFFKQDDTVARREVMAKAVEQAVLNAQALTAGVKASVAETVQISDAPVFTWGAGGTTMYNAPSMWLRLAAMTRSSSPGTWSSRVGSA